MPRKSKAPETEAGPSPNAYRAGKKAIAGYYSKEVWKEFTDIRTTEEKTMQQLLADSLNLMFAKHGSKVRAE